MCPYSRSVVFWHFCHLLVNSVPQHIRETGMGTGLATPRCYWRVVNKVAKLHAAPRAPKGRENIRMGRCVGFTGGSGAEASHRLIFY
jgi:hypothetical protein